MNLRVGSRVRHGQKIWPIVFAREVLIMKLLTVDGLAPSALISEVSFTEKKQEHDRTDVTASEIASLEHEFGDNTVKLGTLVPKPLLTSAEGTEILGGFWYVFVEKVEDDAAGGLCVCDKSQSLFFLER